METRSRKRAGDNSAAPSSSSSATVPTATRPTKRARRSLPPSASLSATPSAATTAVVSSPVSTRSRVLTRSQDSSVAPVKMDLTNESSGSAARRESSGGRRRRNQSGGDKDNSDKGKEKEHDTRARDREREIERRIAMSMDGGAGAEDDEDNDSEEGVGILHQNLTSASSALQGLLRKLGAGLDDLLPSAAIGSASSSHQSGRLKKILSGLRAEGEDGKQVEALTQLCEMLSIATEESLTTFSVDSFAPVLVGLLNHESNPDIMLLAARALTHLCDVLPSSCATVVHYGAVSCFCARLLTIEYMDLAEQSLQALKKISQEHPTSCLRAGALMAVLSYLDFFSTGVQRVALATAANMCKKLPSDAADFVMEAVPLLTNLLHYHDSKVLEHASVCLTRIAEAFASSPDKLDELCNHGLVAQAASLIASSSSGGGQASLGASTYTGLIRLLSTCASGSSLCAKALLLLGISGILKDVLSGSGVSASMSLSPALSRPPEQLFGMVNLANELLPPLPEGIISLPSSSILVLGGFPAKKSPGSSSEKQEELKGEAPNLCLREKLLTDQPELLQQFGMDLLPVLIQIYGSSVNGPVRHKCLSVIGKCMYFGTADMIETLSSVTNISSFLSGVLAWKDPQVLIPALQIAEILMEKLPETFSKMFVREGVVHAIDTLILSGPSDNASLVGSSDKDNNSIPGGSSRSRRYRRRSGNSNTEANPLEEPKSSVSVNIGSPPKSSTETLTVNSNIRTTVSVKAKAFKVKYFPSEDGDVTVGVTEDLLHLKNLCLKLNSVVDEQKTRSKGKSKASAHQRITDIPINKEEQFNEIISEMLVELSKDDGVSTFEFIGSGVVSALLNYFTCGQFSKEIMPEANLPKLRQQALRRYKSFVAIALPSRNQEGSATSMTVLIQKLQNALSSLERFPVVLSHSSRTSSGTSRLSSGLSVLAQPIKLRLCRAQAEKSLRDYSCNVVLIDPLATLAAIEDFLWPRVQRTESGQKLAATAGESLTTPTGHGASSSSISTPAAPSHRPSTRSRSTLSIGESTKNESLQGRSSSSSKGKGKAVLKPAREDAEKGPQTRNATRRKEALKKDSQMENSNGDSSSEDEELDISPVEMDDSLVIEDEDMSEDEDDDDDNILEDDSLPFCTPDKVHDVKLSDSTEDSSLAATKSNSKTNLASSSSSRAPTERASESGDCKGGNSVASRGAMSFAAAAMAGLTSANRRGSRGGRDPQGRPLGGASNLPRLIFTAGGNQLNRNLTIYQAVQRQLVGDDDDEKYNGNDFVTNDGTRFSSDIYTVTYERVESQSEQPNATPSKSTKAGSGSSSNCDAAAQKMSLLDSILQGELPCDLEKCNPTHDILALLRVLEGLNQLAPRLRVQSLSDDYAEGKILNLDDLNVTGARVPSEEFVNHKLTPKLARQIQDALALCSGSLPSWCYQLTKACPFLFPFETRRQYFYSTAFGLSRALHRLQQQGADGQGSANEREVRVGRLQRQKVRVSRNRILESAAKVMEAYSSHKTVLEVEYFGEVGTGLGPTLEFYTLLSHDLQKVVLGMWRTNSITNSVSDEVDEDEHKNGGYISVSGLGSAASGKDLVQAPLGLFPRPWPLDADASDGSQFSKVIEYFKLVGRVMAKALQDGRLLDMPMSPAFYKLVLGQELDLHDILSFDSELGKVLQEMHTIVSRKQYLESMGGNNHEAIAELRFRGALIEDLCLDFTLPGYTDYVLKQGEQNVDVYNLEEYISLLVNATVQAGVARQLEAFKAGFNQVFDISSLQIFSPHELDYLLCGRREMWEAETLVDNIKFDHGFTAKSPAIANLLEIMGEFNSEQQRAFCQFVTGAPRLPPGGLASLNPKLTIVRKLSSTANTNAASNGTGPAETADDDLPSVMTCANYLKLPPYSTKEIMYKKLMYAINEGQGSFDLS